MGVGIEIQPLALRGGEGLNPETIHRVTAAAESLGYRPNNLVTAIRSGRSRMVGVMVPPCNSFWSDVLHGIHNELIERDYVPLALWSQHRVNQTNEASELRQDLIAEALGGLANVTAVYCATDEIAQEVYGVAEALGRRIPADLSVVGYGNVDFGSRLDPSLATVRQRPYRMGKAAAKMVIDHIEADAQGEARIERLPVEFVSRMSTAPASR